MDAVILVWAFLTMVYVVTVLLIKLVNWTGLVQRLKLPKEFRK